MNMTYAHGSKCSFEAELAVFFCQGKFDVDMRTGLLSVVQEVDFETDQRLYTMLVEAYDHGTPNMTG